MKYKLLVFLFLVCSIRVFGQCTLTVNLTASTTSICNGTAAVLTATVTGGTPPYNYAWSSGQSGQSAQSISANKTGLPYTVTVTDQNASCPGVSKSITLIANATPAAPTSADAIACPNTTTTITAGGSTGTYQWYDAAVGGNFKGSGATITTDVITQKTTYYVETTVNGCTSSRTAVNVFPISGPTVTTGSTCPGSSVTLTAAGAGDYKWYDNPSASGNPVGTGATFTTPSLFATTNYYVVGTTAGCVSLPTTATATVITSPAAPTVPGVSTCSGSVATLHASGAPNTVFDWFDVPTGGTSLISSPDYTTPALTTSKTYYVQATIGQCV
ncbi:MAG: type sorting protein, partial [Mucilaginibacter sp.]|nr:type sorting protein [Mucilaginibacter sp.]